MGGGRRELLPNVTSPISENKGRRLDGVDLTEIWHVDKLSMNATHQYVTDRTELMKVSLTVFWLALNSMQKYLSVRLEDQRTDLSLVSK